MIRIGTPRTPTQTTLLLLGAGELGKEVALEAQRFGMHVVAVDRYANAPAMQVAHKSHVIAMQQGELLAHIVREEKPDFIVPEIEAIATDMLVALEEEGWNVIPTAQATRLTMDREGIRRLAAEELKLPTSPYRFAGDLTRYRASVANIGLPCVVKPVMSSSGKGQSVVRHAEEIDEAWHKAQRDARGAQGTVIVEGWVDFDYEITLLTVRHVGGTSFCEPIGHQQVDGDYRASWQPQAMVPAARSKAEHIARTVCDALGGRGVFGVELFVKGEQVWFSEVSPRPHDTGMVTLISQDMSEFALHVRAILGLPIPDIRLYGPSASHVILAEGTSNMPAFEVDEAALSLPDTQLRLFGKPELNGKRRMGVGLARGSSESEAREKAKRVAEAVKVCAS